MSRQLLTLHKDDIEELGASQGLHKADLLVLILHEL